MSVVPLPHELEQVRRKYLVSSRNWTSLSRQVFSEMPRELGFSPTLDI
jgi:hypothetical protein